MKYAYDIFPAGPPMKHKTVRSFNMGLWSKVATLIPVAMLVIALLWAVGMSGDLSAAVVQLAGVMR